MTRRPRRGLRGVRLRRWALLLLAAGCAYAIGRGCDCADPERRAAGRDRLPPGDRGAPPVAGSPAAGELAPAPRPESGGRVVRVRDGDSIVVLRGGVGVEVRLDGIDCPELAQAYGKKAKSHTAGLVYGKAVRLVAKGRDRYGRELAEVFLPDGRSLNRELVSAGYAWWYRKYSADRSLEALEQTARKERRGLWAGPDAVPPWDFRSATRAAPGGRGGAGVSVGPGSTAVRRP